MSSLQRFFLNILPRTWAEDMEAESRTWRVQCPCGYERSVWEMGGIRWKAAGTKKVYSRCSACGSRTWHTIYRNTKR